MNVNGGWTLGADLAGSDMPPGRPMRRLIRVATGSDVGTWSGETT